MTRIGAPQNAGQFGGSLSQDDGKSPRQMLGRNSLNLIPTMDRPLARSSCSGAVGDWVGGKVGGLLQTPQ